MPPQNERLAKAEGLIEQLCQELGINGYSNRSLREQLLALSRRVDRNEYDLQAVMKDIGEIKENQLKNHDELKGLFDGLVKAIADKEAAKPKWTLDRAFKTVTQILGLAAILLLSVGYVWDFVKVHPLPEVPKVSPTIKKDTSGDGPKRNEA